MSQVDYLKILRLRSLRYSKNSISASVHSSHHTVEDVLDAADAKSIAWPIDEDVTNAELELLLFPDKYRFVSLYIEPDYQYTLLGKLIVDVLKVGHGVRRSKRIPPREQNLLDVIVGDGIIQRPRNAGCGGSLEDFGDRITGTLCFPCDTSLAVFEVIKPQNLSVVSHVTTSCIIVTLPKPV